MLKPVAYFVLAAACFFYGCRPGKNQNDPVKRVFPEYHYALDTIIKTSSGIVCGVELGDTKKLIPAVQQINATEKDKEQISYEQSIDSVTKYNITYSLENDTISEIEVLIHCTSHDEGDKILNDLKNYYRSRYTAPLMDKGYFVFNCFDSRKRNFKITLTDNGGTSNSVIDMLIYREK